MYMWHIGGIMSTTSANTWSILALFFDMFDYSLDDLGDFVTLGGHQSVEWDSKHRTTWRVGEIGVF